MNAPFAGTAFHHSSWDSRRLWSLWDMYELRIKPFIDVQDVLVQWSLHLHSQSKSFYPRVHDRHRTDLTAQIGRLMPQLLPGEFDMCRKAVERLLTRLENTDDAILIRGEVDDIRRRIIDQVESVFCLSLIKREQELFEPQHPLFGEEVEAKFSSMSEDISEAGKCLALGRPTACVFHLMRVMEIGVRRFGEVLNVTLADDKNWQNILDEINKAIKALDQKAALTKKYAGAAAHLYNVKLASRNEVMHPKQTYTSDEAWKVFSATDAFIRDLANLI
jgi:hypothetical protein